VEVQVNGCERERAPRAIIPSGNLRLWGRLGPRLYIYAWTAEFAHLCAMTSSTASSNPKTCLETCDIARLGEAKNQLSEQNNW